MQDYHQLEIWQRGMAYAVRIYEFTGNLPIGERFNLTRQMRDAATSVPLNAAEGAGCRSGLEFARFLGYAYRSLKEQITCLELCERLYPVLSAPCVPGLIDEGDQIARMTHALIQRVAPSAPISEPIEFDRRSRPRDHLTTERTATRDHRPLTTDNWQLTTGN